MKANVDYNHLAPSYIGDTKSYLMSVCHPPCVPLGRVLTSDWGPGS